MWVEKSPARRSTVAVTVVRCHQTNDPTTYEYVIDLLGWAGLIGRWAGSKLVSLSANPDLH